jgi:hypothetical protein
MVNSGGQLKLINKKMTFKEYFNKINIDNNVYVIEEWVNGSIVSTHIHFNFDDEEENTFVLGGISWEDIPTFIDITQEVELNEESIEVVDKNNNKIELFFLKRFALSHPTT